MVSRLSRRYLGEETELARSDELVARVRFFFPRDVHKVALAIAELTRVGALPSRPLRVLDLGAGVGAASVGMLRTLSSPDLGATPPEVKELHLVDRDADVLALARALLTAAVRNTLIPSVAKLETRIGDVSAPTSFAGSEPYDLIVLSSVLVETTRALGDEAARGLAVASNVASILDAAPLAPDGALVVIEPATRPETRALHHARASLLARGLGIFAPCTHTGPCPMLARERDWCHEDLPVDLPPWLESVARDAGLRWEGLTFSYLVVRRDARSIAEIAPRRSDGWVPARRGSSPRESKGKTEAFASGAFAPGVTGPRLMQLDREVKHAGSEGARLVDLERGDVIAVSPGVAANADPARPLRVSPRDLVRAATVRAGRSR
jgi:ribosomal protein RSM22 (predicted rRNA methylase)